MWEDSLKIFESDCVKLNNRHGMNAVPLYTQDDIETALNHLVELPFGESIVLFDDLTIRYYHASHIVNAAQVHMTFKIGETTKRLVIRVTLVLISRRIIFFLMNHFPIRILFWLNVRMVVVTKHTSKRTGTKNLKRLSV